MLLEKVEGDSRAVDEWLEEQPKVETDPEMVELKSVLGVA